jgi:ribosomal protein S18 acetylase RimI-like enzyme
MNSLQMQTLGTPFFDRRSVMLAFDADRAVGYVHCTPGPSADGSCLDPVTGQICFLCVDPAYPDRWGMAAALMTAAENYLTGLGAKVIFGGSPRYCAPFYFGFYGGSEPLAFFDSDQYITQTFLAAGYAPFKKTVRFHLNLTDYVSSMSPAMVGWSSRLELEHELPVYPKTWWQACAVANFQWMETMAYLSSSHRPIARILLRIANPDAEHDETLYGRTWDAGLMHIGVHPDFRHQGIAAYVLGETLQHLVQQQRVARIEAHIADDMPFTLNLLRSMKWNTVDTGTLFRKTV